MGSCVQFHSLEHCLLCTECVILIELFTLSTYSGHQLTVIPSLLIISTPFPLLKETCLLAMDYYFFPLENSHTFGSYPPRPELLYCAKACHALLQLIRTNMEASSWVFLINAKLITFTSILWVSLAQIIFKGISSLHRVLFWKSAQWLL